MALNIKNERTHALVRRLAEMTGQSQTSAVEDAVQRRIEELSRSEDEVEAKVERALRIAEEFSADLTPQDREALLSADDYLYDELGLPK
ncbi:type II toxin-antitoxin system VapB family antitoxin [Georgenia sunbinii]|uniref:type II toxin-antitoxin system VapB family antitoxin n=1 Tax=Georgenia sunbinii TaxID=3117728 RepID=UPI002F262B08